MNDVRTLNEQLLQPAHELCSINQQFLQLINELRIFKELRKINQGCSQSMNELCTTNESLVNNDGYHTIIIIVYLPSLNTSGLLIEIERRITRIK